jgi:tetratricopeptide (TPR) repeat protein
MLVALGEADETESPATAAEPVAGSPRRKKVDAELARGASVGRYIVVERLGAGGMGVVYSAFDPELGRKVAIKLVTGTDQERTLREAQALARLAHANVVAIHDVGWLDDRVFLAMELVPGETLSAWLRARARSWRDVVAMFVAAGRGLAAAHAAGIVHRDFKPANVLVGSDGRARVLDFGLARAADELPEVEPAVRSSAHDLLGEDLTTTGSVLGTPVYMPPEAFRGETVGPAGDQFGFCVALYEGLYGERPFDGTWKDGAAPALRQPPSSTAVPLWLRKVILRGLSPRAEDRFASMDALLEALEADPARTRRRVAYATGAALVGIGLVGAVVMLAMRAPASQIDACDIVTPFAGIWDDAARLRVLGAFAVSGKPTAMDDFTRAATVLDDLRGRWLGARTKVCERRRDPALVLQLACLDQGKEEVRSLVDLFEHPDGNILAQAPRAVRQLVDPSRCASVRSLSLVEPPPAAQVTRVSMLRKQLARMRALTAVERLDEALAGFPRLVSEARAVGYPPLLAEVLFEYAHEEAIHHDYSDLQLIDESERVAVASHSDTIATRAAALRFASGANAGENTEALGRLREHARTALERAPDAEAERQYVGGVATLAQTAGDYATATSSTRRLLELASELYGPDSDSAFTAGINLGFVLTLSGRYDESIAVLDGVVTRLARAYGNDNGALGAALDNEGTAMGMVGRYEEAHRVLARAAAMQHLYPFTRGAIQADLARALLGEGQLAEAIAAGERAMAMFEKLGVQGIDKAANMDPLAAAYLAAHRYNDALAVAQRCLTEFRKERKQDEVDEVACLALESTALVELGKPREAQELLDHTLAVLGTAPAAPGVVANLRYQLARALVATHGDRARARALIEDARAELAKYPFEKPLLDEVDAWRARAGL